MHANLSAADLGQADLRGAYCSNVNLMDANLRDTNLAGADLARANLCGADLAETGLLGAELGGASYDSNTRWPEAFDPRQHGATEIGWFVPGPPSGSITLDAAMVIQIAQRALAANEPGADPSTFRYETTRVNGNWYVAARAFDGYLDYGEPSHRLGGHRHMVVDRNGRVLRYYRRH